MGFRSALKCDSSLGRIRGGQPGWHEPVLWIFASGSSLQLRVVCRGEPRRSASPSARAARSNLCGTGIERGPWRRPRVPRSRSCSPRMAPWCGAWCRAIPITRSTSFGIGWWPRGSRWGVRRSTYLEALGLTRKKRHSMPPSRTGRTSPRPARSCTRPGRS